MGVKSTVHLTRAQIIDRILSTEDRLHDVREARKAAYANHSDAQLEERLEDLNDEVNGGEGFENYLITESGSEE